MLEPMRSDTMVFQGPMRLADTWFCLNCEVLFTSLELSKLCRQRHLARSRVGIAIPAASVHRVHTDRGSSVVRPCREGRPGGRLEPPPHHASTNGTSTPQANMPGALDRYCLARSSFPTACMTVSARMTVCTPPPVPAHANVSASPGAYWHPRAPSMPCAS